MSARNLVPIFSRSLSHQQHIAAEWLDSVQPRLAHLGYFEGFHRIGHKGRGALATNHATKELTMIDSKSTETGKRLAISRATPPSSPWSDAIACGEQFPPGGPSTSMVVCPGCACWVPPYYRDGRGCYDCQLAPSTLIRKRLDRRHRNAQPVKRVAALPESFKKLSAFHLSAERREQAAAVDTSHPAAGGAVRFA